MLNAVKIRQFVRDLFGSRFNAHLEEELIRTRNDYETRLLERERVIADLREQVSQLSGKVDRYELVIIPLSSPIGGLLAPKKERPPMMPSEPAEKSWAEVRAEWDEKERQLAADELASKK